MKKTLIALAFAPMLAHADDYSVYKKAVATLIASGEMEAKNAHEERGMGVVVYDALYKGEKLVLILPSRQYSSDTIDFGAVAAGATVTKMLSVNNPNQFTSVENSVVKLEGGGLTVIENDCASPELAPLLSCSITVQFKASAVRGKFGGKLIYTDAEFPISGEVF